MACTQAEWDAWKKLQEEEEAKRDPWEVRKPSACGGGRRWAKSGVWAEAAKVEAQVALLKANKTFSEWSIFALHRLYFWFTRRRYATGGSHNTCTPKCIRALFSHGVCTV